MITEAVKVCHAQARIRERYGINVHPSTLAEYIEQGHATFVAFGAGNGSRIYAVPISGKVVNCVYVPCPGKHGIILTVLPAVLNWEKARAEKKKHFDRKCAAKKRIYRGLRRTEDDEDFDS